MVEGARLESVYTGNRIVGSNPTLSAINLTFSLLKYSVKIRYYKKMKRKKTLTKTQYIECYTKALTYVAQILVGLFFVTVLIFQIF